MTLLSRFQKEIETNKLISKSDRILAAFSGGKDSVCLLFLLQSVRERFGFDLGACHVHHGIRGKEADEDLEFCKIFCEKYKIPFYSEMLDVPAFCKERSLGLEEGARQLRYEALDRFAASQNYNKIATAHSASDQAETVLLHLIRGSGFHGSCGIPSIRGNIIRPLLRFHENEIYDFLKSNNLPSRTDSTNKDTDFARNRMRSKIIPETEKINPSAEKALVRFSVIAKEQSDLVSFLCDRWETENEIDCSTGSVPLKPLCALASVPEMKPVFKEALSRMALKEKIVIDFQHFKMLCSLLNQPTEGKIIEISNGFSFAVEKESLIFRKNEPMESHIDYQVNLSVGENKIPVGNTVLVLSDKRGGKVVNVNKKLLIIHLASDKIEGDLFARNRKEGDAICVDGMTKSIKKLFQEAKVPARLRKDLPIVCDRSGIVWIPYVGLCDRVRKSDDDQIITLSLRSDYFPKQNSN